MTSLMVLLNGASVLESGAQLVAQMGSIRLGIEGLLVGDSRPTDSLCKCVLEKDT